jgi:hypothetical protein
LLTDDFLSFYFLKEYMHQLDPGTSLGLDEDSILSYSVGGVTFGKGGPMSLCCQYLSGIFVDFSSVYFFMIDSHFNNAD